MLRVNSGNMRATNKVEKTISAALLGRQMHSAIRKHLPHDRFDLFVFHSPDHARWPGEGPQAGTWGQLLSTLKRHLAPDGGPLGAMRSGVFRGSISDITRNSCTGQPITLDACLLPT